MTITQSCSAGGLRIELFLIDESLKNGQVELLVEMTNNAEQPITFLPWGTAMESSLKGRAFEVIDANSGEVLRYSGRMVKRSVPMEADYVTLGAGQEIVNQVVISNAYEFCPNKKYSVSAQLKFSDQNHSLISITSSELVFSTNSDFSSCGLVL